MRDQSPDDDRGTGGDAPDLYRRSEAALVARSVASDWGVTPANLRRYMIALDKALDLAVKRKNERHIASIVRVMATIVGQVQADQHMRAKLEHGTVDHDVTIRVVSERPTVDDE